ncbi:5-oxoprolinase, partial [bacterium]
MAGFFNGLNPSQRSTLNRNSPRLLSPSKWRFAVDRGGTFTDVVGLDPSGNFHSLKLLSNSPYYGNASIEGIKRMLGLHKDEALPEKRIEGIRFGTTVATNALLERKGCRSALLITRGFSDALDIGYQSRPDIFSLCIKKSPPLYSAVIEVNERVDSRGRVIRECNAQVLAGDIKRLRDLKVDAVSVVLMHSWANPGHELLCKQLLMEQGYSRVFLSHQTVNLIKIISRGQSTLVDTYLSTVLTEYMEGIKKETGNIPVEFMQSSGTLSHPGSFLGKNALFSGPAGGVVAVAAIAEEKEIKGIIGFDMGGTSTDVSRYDGTFAKRYEQNISGIPLQLEMLDIITVAAGGGSILRFDGQKMTVGPDSAGSSPGPACYGFRGPLTITDANLVTGKIVPDYFPKTFGPDRNSPVNSEVARQKLRILADEINRAMGTSLTPQGVAAGFLRIANEKMAMAIKEISVSRGLDIRQYGLVCFGGAGGQHACALAKLLDIERIFIHPLSGVLSAYGIGLTQASFKTESTVLKPYNERTHRELSGLFKAMEKQLSEKTQRGDRRYEIRRELDLRPSGADTFITVEYLSFDNTLTHFLEKYRNTFGFNLENTPLEVANVRMNIHESAEFFIPLTDEERTTAISSDPLLFQDIYYPEGSISAPVYKRESLPCNRKIPGPAIILDRNSTIVVDPDFEAEQDSSGAILITTIKKELSTVSVSKGTPDPVLLEVFNNIFTGVATEMGVTLKNTAYSVNIKERLDFSCAVFDAGGNLVANAPHIPVHLGAMADTVKALIQEKGNDMKAGDIYLT